MFQLKRLDKYLILRFLELFSATFFICSFILLMQFLWKHITDIVGKGLDFSVILEFFGYSALTVIPLALPLAILLASLMTFGNLGEKMELTAMKAAGISLFRIMRPLIFLMIFVCVGAFFFSNKVLPFSQKQLWSLIYALRETSPELEIPQGEFYSGIGGHNIYVKEKGSDKKLLKYIMIYDFTKGFSNATVTVADSARIKMSPDKMFLVLSLFNGESFENLKDARESSRSTSIPYRRETFEEKEILIDFDANFTRMDGDFLRDKHMSKDLAGLSSSIDSLNHRVDSVDNWMAKTFVEGNFFDRQRNFARTFGSSDSLDLAKAEKYSLDSLSKDSRLRALTEARNKADFVQTTISSYSHMHEAEKLTKIRHGIEWHRKFTLSIACIIFFFIGAPLGAIIRKGGLGVPIVISVVLFIIYYLFDNSGYKLAREDVWSEWAGIWLSTFCLLPIGVFFTYKATKDSPIFNVEAYVIFFKKLKALFSKKNKS